VIGSHRVTSYQQVSDTVLIVSLLQASIAVAVVMCCIENFDPTLVRHCISVPVPVMHLSSSLKGLLLVLRRLPAVLCPAVSSRAVSFCSRMHRPTVQISLV